MDGDEFYDDGFRNDAQRSEANTALWSAVDCSGESCCGWVLTNMDTWVACRGCNADGKTKRYPEEEVEDYGSLDDTFDADKTWKAMGSSFEDDGLPF